MGYQALGVAEIVGDADDLQRVLEAECGLPSALHLKADQRRTALHLAGDDVGLGMVVATRIDHLRHLRMAGEMSGQPASAFGLLPDPERQRLQPLEQCPGVEGREAWPRVPEIVVQVLVDPLLVGQDHAAEAAALAVDMLGRRIDDHMRAELQRLLQKRRRENIVDDQPRADRVGQRGHCGDVDNLQRRVGRAFEEEQPRRGTHGLFPGLQVGAVDQRRLDPVFRHQRLDDPAAGAEQGARGDDVVAGPDAAQERCGDCRHAGCGSACVLRALHRAHALFEHVDRRVGVARVDEARFLALETGLRRLGAVVDEALRHVDRFRGFAELGSKRTAMDQFGGGLPVALRRFGHLMPQKNKKTGRKVARRSTSGPLATCLTWLQADRPNHHGIIVV